MHLPCFCDWSCLAHRDSEVKVKGLYCMPAPYWLAWRPSTTMKKALHPRVGMSMCWLKLEAPRQLIEVWDKGADFSIPETEEGEFHSFLLSPQVEDRHRRRYECGEGPYHSRTLGCSHTLYPHTQTRGSLS